MREAPAAASAPRAPHLPLDLPGHPGGPRKADRERRGNVMNIIIRAAEAGLTAVCVTS